MKGLTGSVVSFVRDVNRKLFQTLKYYRCRHSGVSVKSVVGQLSVSSSKG